MVQQLEIWRRNLEPAKFDNADAVGGDAAENSDGLLLIPSRRTCPEVIQQLGQSARAIAYVSCDPH